MGAATAAVPVEADDEYALVAAGSPSASIAGGLTTAGPVAAAAHGSRYAADHEPLPRVGASAVRPRHHRRRGRLVDVAVSASQRPTLVLRFADVGVATYASLRVVGQPSRTVTWVVEEPTLVAALEKLAAGIAGPARFRDAARRRGTRDRHTGRSRRRPPSSELARDLGAATDRRTGVAAVDRLCGVAARGTVHLAERAAGPGAVGRARDARRRRLSADRARRRVDGGAAEHRQCIAHDPSTGTAARTGRRCWCSIRGCPDSGPTRRSARYSADPSPDTPLARHFGDVMQRRRRTSRCRSGRRVVPAHRRRPRMAGRPARAVTEPAALRRPRDGGRRRCRPCRPRGAAPGRRPSADRVGL